MKLFVSWYTLPELEGLDQKDKKLLWKKCSRKTWRNWKMWVAVLGAGLLSAPAVALWHLLGYSSTESKIVLVSIAAGIGGGIVQVIQTNIARRHIPSVLEEMWRNGEISADEPPAQNPHDAGPEPKPPE